MDGGEAITEQAVTIILRPSEEWQSGLLRVINITVNSISIVCAVVVLSIVLFMWIYDVRLVDRLTFRLQALAALNNTLLAAVFIVQTFTDSSQYALCQAVVFLAVFFSNNYVFLNCAAAFNFQWLFLQKRYQNAVFEKWYYIVSILLSLVLALTPQAFNVYGFDQARETAWYTPSYETNIRNWEYGTYIVPQLLCCSYMLAIVISMMASLKYGPESKTEQDPCVITTRIMRQIIVYPLAPILTQLGCVVYEIYMFTNHQFNYELCMWATLTRGLPGTLALAGFLVDPAFAAAWSLVRRCISYDAERTNSRQTLCATAATTTRNTDFCLPRDNTALVPLANAKPATTGRDKCMRWFAGRLAPSGASDPTALALAITTADDDEKSYVEASGLPSLSPLHCENMSDVVPWQVIEVDQETRDRTAAGASQVDSWLEIGQDDDEPSTPGRMSQWLAKRSDSFDSVRDRVTRSSKSLRRWRRQEQQQQQPDSTARWSRALSLTAVPESSQESSSPTV